MSGLLLTLLLAADPTDLTRFGISATVNVPAGAELTPGKDGQVSVMLASGWVEMGVQRVSYSAFKASLGKTRLTVDEVGEDGEFTLGWRPTDVRRTSVLHSLDHGRLTCQVNADSPQALTAGEAVCRSLKPRRAGELIRLVGSEGPSIELVEGRWRASGRLRLERDGLPVPDGAVTVNGVKLPPSRREQGAFELALPEVEPGIKLVVQYAAGALKGETTLSCPGSFGVKQAELGESSGRAAWTPAPGAVKASVEVASWEPKEKVALPGGVVGWASATDDLMLLSTAGTRAPRLLTFTAFGPESQDPRARLSCRVVRRVVVPTP